MGNPNATESVPVANLKTMVSNLVRKALTAQGQSNSQTPGIEQSSSQTPGTETAGELRGPALVYVSQCTYELGWGGDLAPVSPAWQDDQQCSRPATPL